jgi:hypothetical protein
MTMVMADLRAESAAEACRLMWARTVTNAGDDEAVAWLEGDRPWMAVARGWRTRAALGPRAALIWRVAFEDAAGATAESRLVPVAIDLTHAGRRRLNRRSIEQLVRQLEPRIHREIERATGPWQRAAEEAMRSFASAHAARTRAIVEQMANTRPREFQPGLFDRRAERARDQLGMPADGTGDAAERPAASRFSGTIARRPAQLLLLLMP